MSSFSPCGTGQSLKEFLSFPLPSLPLPAAITTSRQVRTIVEEVQDGKVVSSREQMALTTR